ncbi:MAG: hypothetical protein K6B44_08045 [Lachnospiraceae bacterium]|nr:hypothetical protein [Lachnospiraceae bacterium]
MLAILFILFCIFTGTLLLWCLIPSFQYSGCNDVRGSEIKIPWWCVTIPAAYITGTVISCWAVYLFAYLEEALHPGAANPLIKGNIFGVLLILILDILLFIIIKKRETKPAFPEHDPLKKHPFIYGLWLVLALFLLFFFYRTFRVSDGELKVGLSVFSDFATHVGMERSFAVGNNFPTAYSHYGGSDIRYHFMYQFMMGNLEFLGLRIDHAFNIPSFLGMLSLCMLLYVYGTKLTGNRGAGVLSVVFLLFRSSPSFFKWLAELEPGDNFLKLLKDRTEFWSYTDKENWGLWNLKVYMNQRHLAMAMAFVLVLLILWTPCLKSLKGKYDKKTALVLALFSGIMLGAMSFWNGAMVIGALAILFVIALFSDNKPAFLLLAVIAVGMSMLTSRFFINGSAVSPSFQYGFLADNATIPGTVDYMLKLTGILLILVAICFIVSSAAERVLILAFSAPLILAFTLSLTVDITVGHKYVMLSLNLFGIFAALLLYRLWKISRLSIRISAVILALILTMTGLAETKILYNIDKRSLNYETEDPLVKWIEDNSDSKDLWLSAPYSLDRPVLAGAMLYYGWPYYAWSAGYDTNYRENICREIYATADPARREALLKSEGIRFIIVDKEARDYYDVSEASIAEAYDAVYSEGEDEYSLTVYERKEERKAE